MAKKRAIGTNPLTQHQAAVDTALSTKTTRKKPSTAKRSVGRPPAGLAGERVSDYKRTTIWLPAAAKRKLDALSRYLGDPQWKVVVDALAAYELTQSAADKRAIKTMLARR